MHAGISERGWWDGVNNCETLIIIEAAFIMVLKHPAIKAWTAMEDPLMRVIHSGQCGLALLSHAYRDLQTEKIIVIVDEHVDRLKHVDITEEVPAENRTALKDAMVAMSMDIQMSFQPRPCKCSYSDIPFVVSCTSIADAHIKTSIALTYGAAIDSGQMDALWCEDDLTASHICCCQAINSRQAAQSANGSPQASGCNVF